MLGTLQSGSAQVSLSITLTVSSLSGQAPFSPSAQYSYSDASNPVTISISWGDGSSADFSSCGYNCPGHTYTVPGTYTITISISDSTGITASASQTITVYPQITVYPPQTIYNIQVGALGDDSSRGNIGVGVEIRTSIFPLARQDSADAFWVGDNLQNGAFIQFGYIIQTPGNYCLYGELVNNTQTCFGSLDTVGSGDARWFWQYWPNGTTNDLYFGLGPMDSAGSDGSWHLYQILPDVANGWNFILDGQSVLSFNDFTVQKSNDPAYFVAEEVTNTFYASGSLGPVEFRNLSYFSRVGWVQAQSLTAISNCGKMTLTLSNCNISIPYGVTVLGANDILAGTGEQLMEAGALLWATQTTAQGPPGFALTVSPSLVSLQPGNFVGSTDFTLTLTSIQGWHGPVDFTTSQLPPGITFLYFPSQFSLSSPTASWDVQVNIGPSAQPGSYPISIAASSGSLAYNASVTVVCQ